jgi:hypothetical protein
MGDLPLKDEASLVAAAAIEMAIASIDDCLTLASSLDIASREHEMCDG